MLGTRNNHQDFEPEWVGKILCRGRRGVGKAAFDQSRLVCIVHENIALNFINTYSQYVLVRKEN